MALSGETPYGTYDKVKAKLEREIGLDVTSLERFLVACGVEDFLDSVTILINAFPVKFQHALTDEAHRIFKEEHLAYEIDMGAGIHPFIDASFSSNVGATIIALGDKRFSAVLTHFQASIDLLGSGPKAEGAAAIREAFLAAETLFKLTAPNTPIGLGAKELEAIRPLIAQRYNADEQARNAASKLVSSFADWIDAAHFYRHGQKAEEKSKPPEELAVLLVAQIAAFIRWLASIARDGGTKDDSSGS